MYLLSLTHRRYINLQLSKSNINFKLNSLKIHAIWMECSEYPPEKSLIL